MTQGLLTLQNLMNFADDFLSGSSRSENRGNPLRAQKLCIIRRNNPPNEDGFIDFASFKDLLNSGDQRHMSPGKNRKPHDIDVLLNRGFHHHLRSLMEPRVDDLKAGIT